MILKNYHTIIYPDNTSRTIESVMEMPPSEYFLLRKQIVQYLSDKYHCDFSLRLSISDAEIPLSKIYYTLQKLNALDVLDGEVILSPTDQLENVLYLSVPNANIRVVLSQLNLFTNVDTAIQQSGDVALKQYWEYANFIDSNSLYIQQLTTQLGITQETLEQIFLSAVQL